MAISMDDFTMSQLGQLRWAAARRRVRAFSGGEAVVDSLDARIVWEPKRVVGSYAVPLGDIHPAPSKGGAVASSAVAAPILTPDDAFELHTSPGTAWTLELPTGSAPGAAFSPDDPELAGYVVLDWTVFDEWREEDQIVITHPHDPFQRIDCLLSDRQLNVSLEGVVLADTRRAVLLLETHLPQRWYIPRDDVRMDLLTPSQTVSSCAYKGVANYWTVSVGERTVVDAAWSYENPLHDGEPVRGYLCFYDDRVDVAVAS
ncbi:DUF427 domain-containing protein [Naasia lichenicola]|uniref:DUF427 domain-containing protein n=1 Tax=Naasia lichenicola TaxID=2565933 RepID=A0A4S4FII4_9MICO|nr:DUF427 domain-containing protein [Naasia lichenicola]THG29888.1 DUF427 domain-containing protein [Naasia lichenicola]